MKKLTRSALKQMVIEEIGKMEPTASLNEIALPTELQRWRPYLGRWRKVAKTSEVEGEGGYKFYYDGLDQDILIKIGLMLKRSGFDATLLPLNQTRFMLTIWIEGNPSQFDDASDFSKAEEDYFNDFDSTMGR